jgi:hypothetical protein
VFVCALVKDLPKLLPQRTAKYTAVDSRIELITKPTLPSQKPKEKSRITAIRVK